MRACIASHNGHFRSSERRSSEGRRDRAGIPFRRSRTRTGHWHVETVLEALTEDVTTSP